jgi:hypothetical protein
MGEANEIGNRSMRSKGQVSASLFRRDWKLPGRESKTPPACSARSMLSAIFGNPPSAERLFVLNHYRTAFERECTSQAGLGHAIPYGASEIA